MKQMIRILGATTVLGTFLFAGQPVFAGTTSQATEGSGAMSDSTHVEHHQKMNGSNNHGMMGSHMGQMMGGGAGHMSGYGSGHMMAYAFPPGSADKDLSAEDVKKIMAGRLAMNGNKRLKVGEVKKKDDDTYTIDITTVDDSLVERIEMDRNTGSIQPAE